MMTQIGDKVEEAHRYGFTLYRNSLGFICAYSVEGKRICFLDLSSYINWLEMEEYKTDAFRIRLEGSEKHDQNFAKA